MKKLLLLIVLVNISLIWAQGEYDFSVEYDEQIITTTTEAMIVSDPITIMSVVNKDQESQMEVADMNLVAGAETDISKNKKVLNIPVAYRWKQFGLNATIPYIMSKKVTVYDWAEDKSTDYSTSGLGDIVASVSYGNLYEPYKLYYDISIGAKLPTGDDEAEDDGNLLPLGTGSFDINTGISLYKFEENATFKGKLMYVYNGVIETENTVENISYDTKTTITQSRGGQFVTSIGFDYRWKYNLTFSSDISFGWAFDGETETKTENIYDDPSFNTSNTITNDIFGYSFSDVRQSVTYRISIFDFSLGLRVPVYTYSNSESSVANVSRNFSVVFRTNYRVF